MIEKSVTNVDKQADHEFILIVRLDGQITYFLFAMVVFFLILYLRQGLAKQFIYWLRTCCVIQASLTFTVL